MSTDNSQYHNVVWSSEYVIGHPVIDEQHQRLFLLYQAVCDACNDGVDSEGVSEAVVALAEHTRQHFRDEEQLMEQSGYARFPEHQAKHDDLLLAMYQFEEELEEGNLLVHEVLSFLSSWLRNHILYEDMKLKDGLAGR